MVSSGAAYVFLDGDRQVIPLGGAIAGRWEICHDRETWENDFDLPPVTTTAQERPSGAPHLRLELAQEPVKARRRRVFGECPVIVTPPTLGR
jgi:hypothetical protein